MKTVGAAYLRTHFSRLVGDARRGETIVVTRRGRPIVRLRGLKRSPRDGAAAAEAAEPADGSEECASKVGVFDARENLPRVLDQVEGGEHVIITSHGEPVAAIEPMPEDEAQRRRLEAIAALHRHMDKYRGKFSDLSIRELIEEGRRY